MPASLERRRRLLAHLAIAAVLVCLYLLNQPPTGDTPVYIGDIAKVLRGEGSSVRLLEFGHLFWRPLGYLGALLLQPFGLTPEQAAYLALLIPNYLAGLLCAGLFFEIALLVSARFWTSVLVALAFVCSNAFVNWTAMGSAYGAGLACLTVAAWLLVRDAVRGPVSARTLVLASVAAAASITLWLPYVTVAAGIPAILLFAPGNTETALRDRVRRAVQVVVLTAGIVAACYGAAILAHGFGSVTEVRAWMNESRHGMHASRSIARFAFGFPRTFFDMGRDGTQFKRYLLRDPYAQVTRGQLLGTTLLKVGAFWAFFALLLVVLAARARGRAALAVLLAAFLPLFIFAVFLFDATSSERYLPLAPFLVLASAAALGSGAPRFLRIPLAGVLVLMAAAQVQAVVRGAARAEHQDALARVGRLAGQMDRNSVAFVLMTQDVASGISTYPFEPVNQPAPLWVRPLIVGGTESAHLWRESFARVSLDVFAKGGSVWVTDRVRAEVPRPEWWWTEGDIAGVRWTDFPKFFRQFEYDRQTAGGDGFGRLAPSAHNRTLLEAAAGNAPAASSAPGVRR